MKIKIQLVVLLIAANLAIVPFYVDPSSKAKALFFSFFCSVFFFLNKRYRWRFPLVLDYSVCLFIALLFLPHALFIPQTQSFFVYVALATLIIFWFFLQSYFVDVDGAGNAKFFLRFLSTFGLIVSLLGLYEFFSFAWLGRSHGMLISYLMPVDKGVRVAGIYGQPNLFGLLLLVCILVYVYSYLHDPAFSQLTRRYSTFCYLPFFVVCLVFFLTGSRAGLLAMVCTLVFVALMVVRNRYLAFQPMLKRKFNCLLVVLVLAWIGSYFLNYTFTGVGSRAMEPAGISADARFVFWAAAWLIFLDHPWFGVGLDNFKFYLPEYLPKAHEWLGFVQYEAMGYTKWAHNELLQLACEGGVFVFLLLLLLLGYFGYQMVKFAQGRCEWCPLKFYSHLFIVPFIIQSMFSWPMRHPGLLVLFFTFLAMLAAQYSGKTIEVSSCAKYAFRSLALLNLIAVVFISVQEAKIGLFARAMTLENARTGFGYFEKLISEPCAEYSMLLHITPRYVHVALRQKDVEFGKKILPYVKKLAEIQGAHWQWYNLSAVYNLLGQRSLAHVAIKAAIDVRPSEQKYWSFQHYLNILDASEQTGRSLEDFMPTRAGGDAKDFEGIFDVEGRKFIEM